MAQGVHLKYVNIAREFNKSKFSNPFFTHRRVPYKGALTKKYKLNRKRVLFIGEKSTDKGF